MREYYDDPEVVSQVLAQPEAKGVYRPSLTEFTPEVEALMSIADRLGNVISAVLIAGDRKAPKIHPLARPLTGVQRARNLRDMQTHDDLVNEVQAAMQRYEQSRERG